MYIFHTDRGPDFITMHYERVNGNLIDPAGSVYLGHTIVQTEERPLPPGFREGLFLPRDFLQRAGVMPPQSYEELQLQRMRNVLVATRYPDLASFVAESTLAWKGLLTEAHPYYSSTKFAEVRRTAYDPVHETRTESGIILVSRNADPADPLKPSTYQEFDRWVASPDEMEGIEEVAEAVSKAIAQANVPAEDPLTGLYL